MAQKQNKSVSISSNNIVICSKSVEKPSSLDLADLVGLGRILVIPDCFKAQSSRVERL